MNKKIIIGNWKLNGNKKKIKRDIKKIEKKINTKNCIVSIAPPIVYMSYIHKKIKKIKLTSQNIDIKYYGSYTGDISSLMLKDIGVKYVIIGHSERRIYHKENNEIIFKKILSSLKFNLKPILCIGENIKEYNKKNSTNVCKKQINYLIKKKKSLFKKIIIAYEPIWAIGTGKNASIKHISKIHLFIKKQLVEINKKIKILYGGSVNINNYQDIIKQKNVDGFLIGASSLNSDIFIKIVNNTNNIINNLK